MYILDTCHLPYFEGPKKQLCPLDSHKTCESTVIWYFRVVCHHAAWSILFNCYSQPQGIPLLKLISLLIKIIQDLSKKGVFLSTTRDLTA